MLILVNDSRQCLVALLVFSLSERKRRQFAESAYRVQRHYGIPVLISGCLANCPQEGRAQARNRKHFSVARNIKVRQEP